jgi:hypothetical protein
MKNIFKEGQRHFYTYKNWKITNMTTLKEMPKEILQLEGNGGNKFYTKEWRALEMINTWVNI